VPHWASHGSDAFRILALNWEDGMSDDGWFEGDLPTPQNDLA